MPFKHDGIAIDQPATVLWGGMAASALTERRDFERLDEALTFIASQLPLGIRHTAWGDQQQPPSRAGAHSRADRQNRCLTRLRVAGVLEFCITEHANRAGPGWRRPFQLCGRSVWSRWMKRPILELRSWLQSNGINPQGFELVLVAPNETVLHEGRAAILTELFVEAPSSDGVVATVHGVAVSVESASRDDPGAGGRRQDRRRAR